MCALSTMSTWAVSLSVLMTRTAYGTQAAVQQHGFGVSTPIRRGTSSTAPDTRGGRGTTRVGGGTVWSTGSLLSHPATVSTEEGFAKAPELRRHGIRRTAARPDSLTAEFGGMPPSTGSTSGTSFGAVWSTTRGGSLQQVVSTVWSPHGSQEATEPRMLPPTVTEATSGWEYYPLPNSGVKEATSAHQYAATVTPYAATVTPEFGRGRGQMDPSEESVGISPRVFSSDVALDFTFGHDAFPGENCLLEPHELHDNCLHDLLLAPNGSWPELFGPSSRSVLNTRRSFTEQELALLRDENLGSGPSERAHFHRGEVSSERVDVATSSTQSSLGLRRKEDAAELQTTARTRRCALLAHRKRGRPVLFDPCCRSPHTRTPACFGG